MSQPTVVSALAAALRAAPGRPLLTTYDESTGERVELSLATFDNWVCKLANLFGSDWELEPGDLVGIRLERPWQLLAATVAAWTAGLTVTFDPAAVSAVPVGPWEDFAHDVPGQPDVLVQPNVVTAGDPALLEPSGTSTHADLVTRGLTAAAAVGLEPGGRLVTDVLASSSAGLDIALLAPLVTAASVVLVTGASVERRERIAEQERASCRRWDHPSSSSSSKS